MSGVAVQYAAAMIQSGQAEVIALVYGNNGRSAGMTYGGEAISDPTNIYNHYQGMTSVGAAVAMMYRRYQHEFGVEDGALANFAINNRHNATLNPGAVMSKAITVEEYMAARFIAEPLRLLDYCIINDGAVALIMTTLERARDLAKRPVAIAATAARGATSGHYWSRDFFYTSARQAADRLHRQSGFFPGDIDVVQIYDNFTPAIAFGLEGFGFAPRGEATAWASLDQIGLGGRQPINTSGGHTGESYMQGWGHHVEAVRQLRGECGPRQVPGADVAQYICISPIVSSHILVGA
jgi:acetyl-CoA acetyltransferase